MARELSATARRRLDMQGFGELDDATLAAVDPWLRVAPSVCLLWAAGGTAAQSAAVLWGLVPFAALGAMLRNHPFDVLYQRGIRHLLGSPKLPRYRAPRRFACALAALWLLMAGAAFAAGDPILGNLLGATLVALASVQVGTGFCVPSWLWSRVARAGARPRVLPPSAVVDR